jgi:hypothetical protein
MKKATIINRLIITFSIFVLTFLISCHLQNREDSTSISKGWQIVRSPGEDGRSNTKIEKVIISRLIIVAFFIQVNFSTPYKKNHGSAALLFELICWIAILTVIFDTDNSSVPPR